MFYYTDFYFIFIVHLFSFDKINGRIWTNLFIITKQSVLHTITEFRFFCQWHPSSQAIWVFFASNSYRPRTPGCYVLTGACLFGRRGEGYPRFLSQIPSKPLVPCPSWRFPSWRYLTFWSQVPSQPLIPQSCHRSCPGRSVLWQVLSGDTLVLSLTGPALGVPQDRDTPLQLPAGGLSGFW